MIKTVIRNQESKFLCLVSWTKLVRKVSVLFQFKYHSPNIHLLAPDHQQSSEIIPYYVGCIKHNWIIQMFITRFFRFTSHHND